MYSEFLNKCYRASDDSILNLCEFIPGLQVAGLFYFFLSMVCIGFIIFSCYSTLNLVKKNKIPKVSNYLSGFLYFLSVFCYFVIILGNSTEKILVSEDFGVGLLFLIEILLILSSLHYFFISKEIITSDMIAETIPMEELKENNEEGSNRKAKHLRPSQKFKNTDDEPA